MIKDNVKCTVLVMGVDEYSDILEINAIYKTKYWKDCPYPYVLVTQTKIPENNIWDKVICTSVEMNWMERLKTAMGYIETPYVLLMADDYFWNGPIDVKKIESMLNDMNKNDVGLLKILPDTLHRDRIKIGSRYEEYTYNNAFRISYGPDIWKTEYLKKYAEIGGGSIWNAERENSIRSKDYSEKIWILRKREIPILHTIMSGCWTRSAVRSFKNENIDSSLYLQRKVKPLRKYTKDITFNVVMSIAPHLMLKLQKKLKIGRGY